MEIMLLNKTCKYHKYVFATERIFCIIPKTNEYIPLLFMEGALQMLTSGFA